MAERDVTIRLKYEVSGNALDYLRRLEQAQSRVASGQGGVRAAQSGLTGNMPAGAQPGGGLDARSPSWERGTGAIERNARAFEREWERGTRQIEKNTREFDKAWAQGTKAIEKATKEYEKSLGRVTREIEGGGSPGSTMQQVRQARLFGALAGFGTLHATTYTMQYAADYVATQQRADMTEGQKARTQLTSLPFGFGNVARAGIELAEAIHGITERVRQASVGLQIGTQIVHGEANVMAMTNGLNFERASLGFQANALSNVQPVFATGDRTTVAGEAEYRASAALAPHRQALAISDARVLASRQRSQLARQNVAGQQELIASTESQLSSAMSRRNELVEFANAPRGNRAQQAASGVPHLLAESTAQVILLNQQLAAQKQELIRLAQQQRTADEENGRNEVTRIRTLIGLQQTEMALLEHREQMMSRGALRLALMNPFDRQQAISAFREGQERGFENLPWWRQQQAMQADPETVGRALTGAFQRTEFFQEREAAGAFGEAGRGGRTSDEIRLAIAELGRQLQNNELVAQQTEANSNLKALNDVLGQLIQAIKGAEQNRVNAFGFNVFFQNLIQNSQQNRN